MSDAFGTNSVRQAALLIDADNFADPKAIDAAWAEFNAYAGRVSVCRAYGYGPRLQSLGSVWRYLGTRTFPNLPLEKNTTDSALIADAVALHFQQGIRLFAIASGDADFAPLAVRLREWGCEVWCFSMEGIVFRDAETYYDRVKCFPAPVCAPPPVTPAPVRPVMPSACDGHADAAGGASIPIPAAPACRAATAPLNTPAMADARLPDEVQRILNVLPGLRERPQQLCHVVPVLQRHGFFDKRITKSTAFLGRYAAYFELSPAHKPTLLTFCPSGMAGAIGDSAFDEADFTQADDVLHDTHEARVMAAPSPEDESALERVLAKSASWHPGTIRQLNAFSMLLEENGVVLGDKPLDALFSLYPDYFELLPAIGPATKVRLLKKPQDLEFVC
ncbi:hypothetical protein RCH06_001309 [Polaromonas sp. CG_9.5]|uniref:NYN domain-containing protein n=1 Tax=Polaromonas sp. CG_9.5 TaxID=3071705 RepID=UPI002DFB08B5|nr:hypothetical protein [Polaromonas sp. CG_9.5]